MLILVHYSKILAFTHACVLKCFGYHISLSGSYLGFPNISDSLTDSSGSSWGFHDVIGSFKGSSGSYWGYHEISESLTD